MLATVVATTTTLSSNSCKSASFLTHFTSVLRKQFAGNDKFLRKANSYKRALALRNSWLVALVTYLQALAYADKPRSMSTLLGFNVSVLSSWLESSTPAPTDVVRCGLNIQMNNQLIEQQHGI